MASGLLIRDVASDIAHLGMSLGGEFFCLPVLQVQEIQNYENSTPIPGSPGWLRGVMNLRGDILSVVDISSFLGLAPMRVDRKTKMVVVEGERYNTAILVDAVMEVLAILPNEIRSMEEITGGVDRSFIRGAYLAKETLYAILDVNNLLASEQMLQFQ